MLKGKLEIVEFVVGTLILTATGLRAIENIRAGDRVLATDPESGVTEEKAVVETYVRETGQLVHLWVGGELISTTPNHPFWVRGRGFVSAGELQAGEELLTAAGEGCRIENVRQEIVESPERVYNFQVEGFHTYHVGSIGVLVHNTGCGGEGGAATVNGFDTTINTEKQGKHIVGNNNYIEGRSIFNGTVDDAQRLVDNFAGTGEWIGANKERVNFGEVIGQYVNPITNEVVDTTVGIIHYSKTGTHIVPAQPVH